MKENFKAVISSVLDYEGEEFTDDPVDPGGPTKWGITIFDIATREGEDHSKVRRGTPLFNRLKKIVQELEKEDAIEIYKTKYWDKLNGDDLNDGVDMVVVDMGINAGLKRSIRLAQDTVGAEVDGMLGPKTMTAINSYDPEKFIHEFSDKRREYYKGLGTFWRFGKGWLRRVANCENVAIDLLNDDVTNAKTPDHKEDINTTEIKIESSKELPWIEVAKSLLGTEEEAGSGDNPTILGWAKKIGLNKDYTADSIPWCGLYVAYVVSEAGMDVSDAPLWALSWKNWGETLKTPAYGALLVFKRNGGGHVGFAMSQDDDYYHVLGGNQSDKVCVTKVAKDRCVGIRWPSEHMDIPRTELIVKEFDGEVTTNER